MSIPEIQDYAFPNTATVRLCDDRGNSEGGQNPFPGSPYSFAASIQSKPGRWEVRNGVGVSVTPVKVYFQSNPNLTLTRPIRAGDQIINEDGLILSVVEPIFSRGGLNFLWLVGCEYVNN